tara:strand:+ start:1670 stop:1870 length:201 start_codon:yes stop_codon:yes gene_type:complete
MVLKRKKIEKEPTGDTGNRKGYRSRSSTKTRKSVRELKALEQKSKRKSPIIVESETLMNYYKDLLK